MKRNSEIQECREWLSDESTDHLHIRRKAIVSGFTDDLRTELEDCKVISVDIYEWEYDELMETLRATLQKELSLAKYYYSRLTSGGLTLFGFGSSGGTEPRPDYTRTTDYLHDVAEKADDQVVVFINYNGTRPVDGYGWISKLEIPENATIVTDGFTECRVDESSEFEIGRLTKQQSVEYLTDLRDDIDERDAAEVHEIHDGNPVAIEIANEQGTLQEELTGDDLRDLWSKVYDDKISGEELDLLTESSHLIDLDQRDVASVTDKTRGEAKKILQQLERKGVVSKEQSGLFTTDQYVKRYTASRLSEQRLSAQHRMSFHDCVEKWVDAHESRMQEMKQGAEADDEKESVSSPDFEVGMTDPNLYLAIHHLSGTHDELDKERFVEELAAVEAEASGMFTFGLLAQRFFFDDPEDIIQEMAETLLGIEEDIENELFSGTIGVLTDFDIGQYLSLLAEGWSEDTTADAIDTENAPQPDEVVKSIQQGVDADFYQNLPQDVKVALARLFALTVADPRTANDYYKKFGKTAEKYGLDEEGFCQWVKELEGLVEELTPETGEEDADDEPGAHEKGFESLSPEIRDRTDLRKHLEENRSQAQRRFQQRVEKIREKPDKITEQYIRCGEQLAKSDNSVFPYLWYAVGHNLFTGVVLGKRHWEIYGKYREWAGAREEQEKSISEEELAVTKDEIESLLD